MLMCCCKIYKQRSILISIEIKVTFNSKLSLYILTKNQKNFIKSKKQRNFIFLILMTKIHAYNPTSHLRLMVTNDVYNDEVETVVAVRRPLDCPSTMLKLGKVLSHSGCILKTKNKGYVLVEYMSANQIFVSKVYNYHEGLHEFNFKKYHFTVDKQPPQKPSMPITVKDFTEKMIQFTKDLPFNTFTHNCHHARYDTMHFYGMKSDNPDTGKYNLFYQGFVDYFHNKDSN